MPGLKALLIQSRAWEFGNGISLAIAIVFDCGFSMNLKTKTDIGMFRSTPDAHNFSTGLKNSYERDHILHFIESRSLLAQVKRSFLLNEKDKELLTKMLIMVSNGQAILLLHNYYNYALMQHVVQSLTQAS